ncbi:MAG: 2,3-diaminopropionate biosynthesis protein SbnA [Acidobacteriota bacterium]|nr:2,3-diaminopropionate biosynthesis protein SbnA [Acidobacteriota bacterium]
MTPSPEMEIAFAESIRPPVSGGLLETIGNTPLLRLGRLIDDCRFQLYAKMESFNPGGSVKDRPALNIIRQAMARGEVDENTTIVEYSSGNFGIGLAQVCAFLGLKLICVTDARTTKQNIDILRVYGATVDMVTKPDPVSGELLQACVNRVQELCAGLTNSFWPNQHANTDNSLAHRHTMHEIATALEGKVDYLFCATSTCGTLRGCAEYVREHGLDTRIIAVDAKGSLIFSNKQSERIIPGHGAGRPPKLLLPGLCDKHVHVSALESILGCRLLLKREAVMAGGSSGGIISAVMNMAPQIPQNANCVIIICDRGERYLNTVYSDAWVRSHYPDFQAP